MSEGAPASRSSRTPWIVAAVLALALALLVGNSYRVKWGRMTDLKSADPAPRERAARAMLARGEVPEQLQGEPASIRLAAVRALGGVRSRAAAENLVGFMKDPDQPVRERAIWALVALGPELAVQPVVDRGFADSDDNVKRGSIQVCKQLGTPAIEPAARKLVTEHRRTAAEALVEITKRDASLKPRVVSAVAPYAGPANPIDPAKPQVEDTRVQAIDVLDRGGDVSAVPTLIAALEQPQTRRAAVGALGRKGDARAVPLLLEWLPRDDTVRHEIVIALGQIRDPRATRPLIDQGLGGVSDSVRAAASDSLRSIGAPAVPALAEVVRGAGRFSIAQRAGAARALAGMRLAAAQTAALAALSAPEATVREAAADAFGEAGDPRVVAPLVARFGDADPGGRVQAAAARSLAALGPAAVPRLVAALGSRDNVESYWAGQALLLLGRPAVPALSASLSGPPETARRAARLLGDLGDPAALPSLRQAMARHADPEFQFAARTAVQRLSENRPAG